MIKAVFFDIDGTLLSFKTHKIPTSTENAIEALKAKGIKVIIATGRSINSLEHIQYLDFDGYITFNGGYCITKEKKVLYKQEIAEKDINSLIAYGQQHQVSFSLMSEKEISIYHVTPEIADMYTLVNLPIPAQRSYDGFAMNSVLQANIFIQPEEQETFMKQVMPASLASRWTPLFADVNPAGQSKQVGIDIFMQHFGIALSETMSFGDGGNDISMLKHTAYGIAMGNANPEVKEIADYVTDAVDDDGIWNALKHFSVI